MEMFSILPERESESEPSESGFEELEIASTPIKQQTFTSFESFIRKPNNIDSGRPILVGTQYQAEIPNYVGSHPSTKYRNEADIEQLSFSYAQFKAQALPDEFLAEFCRLAKRKHSFEIDQALQFLHAYDYNIAEAFAFMDKFYAVQSYKWDKLDRRTFRTGYQFFGKDFISIHNLLKHKTYYEIIEFYFIVYKRMRYTLGNHLYENLSDEIAEYKSPSVEKSFEQSRKAKKNAMMKVQKCGPKSKMVGLRKRQGNKLCSFSKTQLRELMKPQNQPEKIREKITSLKKELDFLCAENEDFVQSVIKTDRN